MRIGRRDFLKTVGSVSVAGGLLGHSKPAVSETAAGDASAFAFADDRVPMNSANLCPMPRIVSEAVVAYGSQLDTDMSGPSRKRIEALKEDARSRMAALLGASADEIAFPRNTSEANATIVQGIDLSPGDEVLLWDQNHPSNSVAWDVQAARNGCSVRRVSVPLDADSIEQVVAVFADAVGPNTRVVSFTHISNVTGFRLPAAEIIEAVKRKGDIHVHVDGAQTWGVADVDLHGLGCDSFSGSSHKWFMGPREVGLLYVREDRIEAIWPHVVTAGWGIEVRATVEGARKFEVFGQRDDAALAALGDAAGFHETMTPVAVEKSAARIADRLRDGLTDLGVPFVSSRNPLFTSNVIILAAAPETANRLVANVLEDGGIVTAAVGGFRMSPHVYNTDDHIDRIVAAVAKSRALLMSA